MKITDLKISTRLGAAFAAVLLLTASMTGIGIWELSRVADAKNQMAEAAQNKQLADEWLRGIATNSVRTFAKAKSDDIDDQQYFDKEMVATSKRVSEIQKELGRLIQSPEGKRLFSDVLEKRKTYTDIRDGVFKVKKESQAGDETALKNLIDTKMVPAMNAYMDSVQKMLDYQSLVFDNANTRIDEVYESSRTVLVALGAIAVVLGAILAWLLARSITRPLNNAVALAQTVASGDLSSDIEVKSRDEVGQLLNALKTMNGSLLKTVMEVRSGTDTIATASRQIAVGNLDLSARTEEQASSLEETASSMEELTSTVKQNAENAQHANSLAITASDVAAEGGKVIGQVVGTMGEIDASAKKIVDIISVIDGIAFQTNILALNAAVEAARAGEQGRGFAVVASEVRTLAQRSAAAAKEIKTLIDASVERVETGSKLVNAAGATMDNIVVSVRRVTDIMAEITAASHEQTSGINQINQAITQMDTVTQQNASLVEEAAAASEAMQEQAAKLAQVVSVFKIDANPTPAAVLPVSNKPVIPSVPRSKRHVVPRREPLLKKPAQRQIAAASSHSDWEEF